jgi:gliding motility-associated-like protein
VVSDLICADPEIFVPNAFSPDADGLNDEVFVRGRFIESLFFQIYNRWGELVFETRDQQRGWDGTHRGELATPDVYVYYLEAFCIDGQRFEKKGNITLIR